MIRILQSISTRERVMLGAFVIVCLLIWASSLSKRWDATAAELRDARKDVKQQQIWIDSEAMFQAQLDQTMAGLDPAEMVDSTEVTARIDSYARDNQLKHEMGPPEVKQGKIYTKTTIRVTLRNVSLQDLIKLQLYINERQPYVTMGALALSANRADPRMLNARFSLTAIKVNPIETTGL